MIAKSDKQIKEQYANMIRKWRLKHNIGLRDFAKIIEISPSVLSHIETGMTKEECKDQLRKLINNRNSFICYNNEK